MASLKKSKNHNNGKQMSILVMDIPSIFACEDPLIKITPPTLDLFFLLGMIALHRIVPR